MCGIIGFFGERVQFSPTTALNAISHRGPNAQAHHLETDSFGSLFLGHTRLSIVELSDAGAQPMTSRDGRWVIVYNGEIYNHDSLRKPLSGPFKGSSDTETLLELIAQRGLKAALSEIDGMTAFAAYDRIDNKLHLYRDPFGIKPLYFMATDNAFYFCSELRGLAAMGVDFQVDNDGLDVFLTLRYSPSPQTLLKNIQRLPPGHLLTLDFKTASLEIHSVVQPSPIKPNWRFDEALLAYTETLKGAIQRQLMSDVPVGMLLSGGIDSAMIAAMAKEAGTRLKTFTVGFGNQSDACEIDDAAHTAAVLGLDHAVVSVDPESLWPDFAAIVGAIEEPLGTTSVLPMWQLTQRARQDVTVVLTGQGSDEPWGGYRRYQMELIRQKAPNQLWKIMSIGQRLARGTPRLPEHIRRGLRSLPIGDDSLRFLAAYEMFSAADRLALTGRDQSTHALTAIRKWLDWLGDSSMSSPDKMMRIDSRLNLADDLLLYGDKISMAFALEARVPMLDLELMRLVESFPLRFKASLGKTKILHKAAAEAYLPAEIVHRPKKGFQVPFGEWSRGIWKNRLEETLLESGQPHLDYLDRDHLQRLWSANQSGAPDMSRHLFALVSFAFWMRWVKDISH